MANLPARRTNVFTNPSCESVGAVATVRTNNFANPSAETNTTGLVGNYGTSGAGNITRQTSGGATSSCFFRQTWTTASTVIGGYSENAAGTLPVGTHTISLYVRVSRAAQRLQLAISAGTGAGTLVSNPAVDVTVGNWTRISATYTVTTQGTFVARATAVSGGNGRVWAINDTLDTDGWLADLNTSLVRQYFDGSTAANNDMTFAWAGTAHASASYQQCAAVTSFSAGNAFNVSSTAWALKGTKSLRITPNTNTADTFGVVQYTLQSGKTYTISATCRLSAAQTGTLDATRARSIVVYHDGTDHRSTQATNAAGVTRLSVTFTMVDAGVFKEIRLYNGAQIDGGDVWWDAILVEETGTLQDYFDGDGGDGGWSDQWSGAAHASSSYRDATGLWVDVDLTGTAHTVLTVLGLGPTTATTKVVRSDGKNTFPVPGWLARRTTDADTGLDYTVPLGRPVTYTLFKDGIAVASRTVTVNAATGDIMDPANPTGGIKITTVAGDPTALTLGYGSMKSATYENVQSEREYPLGARFPIVRTGVRGAAQEVPFVLQAYSNTTSDALLSIVEQAPILLIRSLPSWGSVPPVIYTDASVEEAPFNRGTGGQFTQWRIDASAVAPVTRAPQGIVPTHDEVQANLADRTHDSIQAASGTKRHVEIQANPLGLGQ